jgi:hypothetical protein
VNVPITDIIIIHASEKKAPPGYVLLERTSTGLLAADLNRGCKGASMYVCYKRVCFLFLYFYIFIFLNLRFFW